MKNKTKWYLFLGTLLLAGVATTFFLLPGTEKNQQPDNIPPRTDLPQSTTERTVVTQQDNAMKKQSKYTSKEYGFSFEYPESYCTIEQQEPDGLFVLELHSTCPIPSDWKVQKLSPHSFEYLKGNDYAVIMAEKNSSDLENYIGAHTSSKEREIITSVDGKTGYKFNSACVFNVMNNHVHCSDKEKVWHFKNEITGYIFTIRGNEKIATDFISTLSLGE